MCYVLFSLCEPGSGSSTRREARLIPMTWCCCLC